MPANREKGLAFPSVLQFSYHNRSVCLLVMGSLALLGLFPAFSFLVMVLVWGDSGLGNEPLWFPCPPLHTSHF